MNRRKPRGIDLAVLGDDGAIQIRMVGWAPNYRPYLYVGIAGKGPMIDTVTKKRSLRALAHRILRAIGDE